MQPRYMAVIEKSRATIKDLKKNRVNVIKLKEAFDHEINPEHNLHFLPFNLQ
jgi:hypothetical protein